MTPDKATQATRKVTLTEHGNLDIRFPYDPVLITRVKTLSCRQYHSGPPKRWTAPPTADNIAKLHEWGFALDRTVEKPASDAARRAKLPVLDFGELDGLLDNYQKEGVRLAEHFRGRALFADDPGLGKTVQALTWLRLHPEARPAVIVSKKSGKLVWRDAAKVGITHPETGDYVPLLPADRVQVVSGQQPVSIDADVVIANYDILARVDDCEYCAGDGERGGHECSKCGGTGAVVGLRADIDALQPKTVILDEPQMICNRKAQRTIATLRLAKKAPHLISATASPFKNRPREFFNVLNATRPDVFHSFWHYAQDFCGAKHLKFGWNFDGATNLDKLNKLLTETLMIRRTTEQVMGHIKPPTRIVVPLEIENYSEYEQIENDYVAWLRTQDNAKRLESALRAEGLTKQSTLFKVAARFKTEPVIEWLRDFLEYDRKLIVFTMHTRLLEQIIAAFPAISVRLDGSSTAKQRQEAEHHFQHDPGCLLFVGNSAAAGDTITLTAAHDVAFAELPQTSEDVRQNEGRAFARKNDPHTINSWFLVAAGTVEEQRARQINKKAAVVRQTLDGQRADEGNDLIELAYNMI